jgi:hypothetical protein
MTSEQQTHENQAFAAPNGGQTAARDVQAAHDAPALPDAANSNEDPAEDVAEVYFAHG